MSVLNEEKETPRYASGNVVQLRSGGPLLTVSFTSDDVVTATYFNAVTGLFERLTIVQSCLRSGTTQPMAPEGQEQLRRSPARSSFTTDF